MTVVCESLFVTADGCGVLLAAHCKLPLIAAEAISTSVYCRLPGSMRPAGADREG